MLRECSPPPPQHVTCHRSHVTYRMSHVICHMSCVTCNNIFSNFFGQSGGGSVINAHNATQIVSQNGRCPT